MSQILQLLKDYEGMVCIDFDPNDSVKDPLELMDSARQKKKRCWSRLVILCECELHASNAMMNQVNRMHKETSREKKHKRSCDCIVHKAPNGEKVYDFSDKMMKVLDDSSEIIKRKAELASMSPEDQAAKLADWTPTERTAVLAAMPLEDMAAVLAAMSPEDRAAALADMSEIDRKETEESDVYNKALEETPGFSGELKVNKNGYGKLDLDDSDALSPILGSVSDNYQSLQLSSDI